MHRPRGPNVRELCDHGVLVNIFDRPGQPIASVRLNEVLEDEVSSDGHKE